MLMKLDLFIFQPWTVKYRRLDGRNHERSATLDSPNGSLRVTEDGVYEIIGVNLNSIVPSK